MAVRAVSAVRRTEIREGGTLGVLFEPAEGSDHFVVMLGGSFGGFPESPARKLAESGVVAFALGYFGAPGLPSELVDIPLESLEQGIEWFRENHAGTRSIGLVGFSKGAELALVLAARMQDAIGPVVAIAPSHVAWFGLTAPGPGGDRRSSSSSWSVGGNAVPFLRSAPTFEPVFTEMGLRTDVFFDLKAYTPSDTDAARIRVEEAAGPMLLLSGDDDHQWPAAAMAAEIERRMEEHGRGRDITNVVYPGAGHVFLIREFIPPAMFGVGGMFDYGGSPEADAVAGGDAWRRIGEFLTRGTH
jgi:dienelactone hydrolase